MQSCDKRCFFLTQHSFHLLVMTRKRLCTKKHIKAIFGELTRRNGGRVCALQKRWADSLGMQQAGLHKWKQSLPHCHRRYTGPLLADDCHRLALWGTLIMYTCGYSLFLALLSVLMANGYIKKLFLKSLILKVALLLMLMKQIQQEN